jgi:ABC-type antimicrobial peptide transport system permease subunit
MREKLQVAFFGGIVGAITGVLFGLVNFGSYLSDWAWVALAITLPSLVAGGYVLYHKRHH